jgi:hypothetical protein
VVFQQDGHHNGLKRSGARDHHAGLHLELGAVKEAVNDRLIVFREHPLERCPPAAFGFEDALTGTSTRMASRQSCV